jgi:hypothetical protein
MYRRMEDKLITKLIKKINFIWEGRYTLFILFTFYVHLTTLSVAWAKHL